MRYLIFLISALFILNAEELQIENQLKIPPQIDDKLILAHSSNNFPKSIILIIADGAGIGQYTLAYYANENFPFKQFQHIGLVATHPDDGYKKVTDSASSGTAMATGQKTYNGAISVDSNGAPIKTVMEIAHELGMATGVVSTSTVTHATPASFLAHIDSRNKEGEIARQLAKSNADVIFGGGQDFWTDNVISILEENNGQLITRLNQGYDPSKKIVGLFDDNALPPHSEGRNPTTTQMTERALDILDNNTGGFFLMVEESQVDWGGHSNSAAYIKGEMESLSDLVEMCLNYQRENPNVLVVLTADHECGGVAVDDGENGNLDIQFTTSHHTANFVPIWASGPGADFFNAMIDNTMIGKQLIKYVKNQ